MTPTSRKRAENAYCEWYHDKSDKTLIEHIEYAITSAIADQTAALQAALEELAKAYSDLTSEQIAHGKTMQERDGLAAALVETHGALEDMQRTTHSNTIAHKLGQIIDDVIGTRGLNVLAAHDRKVAAGVLRAEAAEWRKSTDITHRAFAAGLIDSAEEYEAGERKVPNAD